MKLHIEWTRLVQVVLLLSLFSLPATVGRAFGQTPFYQGKTITLVRGSTPGGIGAIREIPRDAEIIELYKKFSAGDPLPNR